MGELVVKRSKSLGPALILQPSMELVAFVDERDPADRTIDAGVPGFTEV